MYSVRSKTKQKQKSPSINFLPLMWCRVTLAAAHAEIRNQPAHCGDPTGVRAYDSSLVCAQLGPTDPFLDRVNWPIDLSSFIGVIKENPRL